MENKKLALFVDDEPDFLSVVQLKIRHPMFEIKTSCSKNAYQSINGIIEMKPDVIFLDFNLPRVNGSQLVPILKAALQKVPIYLITGFPQGAVTSFLEHVDIEELIQKDDRFNEEIIKILDELAGTSAVSY